MVLNSAAAVVAQPLPRPVERRALLDLRSSLGISAKSWHKKANPCLNWTGIECRNGHVVAIKLSGLRRSNDGKVNPRFAVDSLQNFPFLSTFNSSGFVLAGPIPVWLGTNMSNLRVLDLSSSSISGSIPLSLGSLSSLEWLNLSNNSITGSIPIALEKLQSLTVLDLSQNSLAGQIPKEISSLRNLTILDLSLNYLSVAIPLDLDLLSKLKQLNLSRNSLSSSIPSHLANLSEMEELDLGFNSLSGELPQELGELRSLKYLDVSRNNLTGVFPNQTAFFNAAAPAAIFNFSGNLFYGNVSSGFGDALVVDLSSNYFGGEVPNERPFRLSNNCFLNRERQREFGKCSEFYKYVGIPYGNNGGMPPPPPPPLIEPIKRRRSKLVYAMIGVFGGIGIVFISVTALLLLLRSRRTQIGDIEQPHKFVADSSGLGKAFTYEELLVATSSFSSENLIKVGHSGSLFRARLDGGELVVVKKVDLQSIKEELSVAELELFVKAAHQRLVPLVGHCFDDENVKFLVYKYMPNGDLSNALYRLASSEEGLQSLDWITRLKIAIGAAEALAYLHNECIPPLVHRDVQASSILLDDKYEVRLGSFSEACASGGRGSCSSTCAYDVYCLGKVLLELVTGKLGISKMSDADAQQLLDSNLPFISIYDKEMVNKIMDQSLIVDEDLLEEVWAVAVVAKSCLNPKASRRPSMRHVVRALENPFKVVRDENFSSGRRSSRQSWTAALFGSWHYSSSDSSNVSSQTSKEIIGGLRRAERAGSRGRGTNELSSSHKRLSSEVFPQPREMEDVESGN
ncbi:probable LRR receptor-like serine/threonine-protein kinase At2g16250 isoform X2 [Salvia splendens]|nr:probable LRR receptor-like serine/threonine-protein kinase At2g16250 isoform X2 [Salvia splendens]